MKVQSVNQNYTAVDSRKNPTFGDHVGEPFTYKNAMSKLREHNYVVKGYNNADAFGTLYDDVKNVMRVTHEADMQWAKQSIFRNPKYEVSNWNLSREMFVATMSNFWETSKKELVNIKEAGPKLEKLIESYLTNIEKLKKPGFFASLFDNSCFFDKEGAITAVFKNFISTGQYKLK